MGIGREKESTRECATETEGTCLRDRKREKKRDTVLLFGCAKTQKHVVHAHKQRHACLTIDVYVSIHISLFIRFFGVYVVRT